MAAQAWTFYREFKKYMADGFLDMDGDIWRISLYTSASDAATDTQSTISEITNEVASVTGYSTSGKTLSATTWTTGASTGEMRFDATAVIWTATASDIVDVKFAIIWASGASAGSRKLMCFTSLSSGQFTVGTGNTLTITPSANGIWELN